MKLDKKRKKLRVVNNQQVNEEPEVEDKRKKLKMKIILLLIIICSTSLGVYLFSVYRTYNGYKVNKTIKIETGKNSHYKAFGDFVIKYSNDGISYIDGKNTIWNEAYEMKSPIVDICGQYLAIADKNSNTIYIFNKAGKVGIVTTTYPIIKLEVAKQGVVAALLEDTKANYIEVYDKEGKILVSHKALLSENGFPLAFSVSDDGIKMAVSYLSINNGSTDNKIMFYNFSNVGKDEVDRMVGSFNQNKDTIVPAVYFVSNDDAIALGDNVISIYKMKEKPSLRNEIKFKEEIQKVFYNDKYVGVVFANSDSTKPYTVEVYSLNGNKVMSSEIDMDFDNVQFAGKNVLLYNDLNCRIISLKGVVKFKYTFTASVDAIIPRDETNTFLLMNKNKIQEISLKYK